MSDLDRVSDRYREHHRTQRTPEFVFGGAERAALFRRLVGGPGLRIADLGCRYGALTRAYLEGNSVVGVDVDRDALAEAAKLGIETRWADVGDRLPFDDATFDVVVAGELLEHIRDPEHVVSEAVRILVPGGRFVGSVPNAFRLLNRFRFLAGLPPERDPTHLHMFTPDDVRTLLRAFDEVHIELIASRFLRLHRRLFANDIVFVGRKRR